MAVSAVTPDPELITHCYECSVVYSGWLSECPVDPAHFITRSEFELMARTILLARIAEERGIDPLTLTGRSLDELRAVLRG
jgi:hypothetical protein